jgi:hypothetical protein
MNVYISIDSSAVTFRIMTLSRIALIVMPLHVIG